MTDPDAVLQTAERHYAAGLYARAIDALQDLTGARHPAALGLLGLCQLRSGDIPGALASLHEATLLAPGDALLTLRYGVGLQAAGQHRQAIGTFLAASAALPRDPAPPVNLATSFIALEKPRAAVIAARRAVARAPDFAGGHYMLGRALMAADRAADATAPLQDAVRLAPAFAEAWVALGAASYLAADLAGAERATRHALTLDRGHEAANANLASFLRLTGRAQEADALLTGLLARNPAAAMIRTGMAADLMLKQRPAEALALLDGPPPSDPLQRAHWRLQLSLALLQSGRTDAARSVLDAIRAETLPAALRPLAHWREVLLAAAPAATVLAEEMAGLLDKTPGMLPEHRLMGWYDLARFWSERGQPGRAIGCWQSGHALLARLQPFDRAGTAAWFDAMEQAFDAPRLAREPQAINADAAPIFIVGMPRSGTTLCEQILAAHPLVFGAGERTALQMAFNRLGGDETAAGVWRAASASQSALNETAWDALHALHALAPSCKRIVDKMPGNFRLCGLIHRLFPRAKIIHCLRDPRDIGLSIFTFRFYGHHPYAHDLGDLGWYIARERRMMAHWAAAMPDTILAVRLDEWVTQFDATLRRVLDFVGLPWDDACTRFYESTAEVQTVSRLQVRQPVNARGLGRWRGYSEWLQPLLSELDRAGILPDD